MACQAQQSPTPSDAKLADLTKILQPLLHYNSPPESPQSDTRQVSSTNFESPSTSYDGGNWSTSADFQAASAANSADVYQVPDKIASLPHYSDLPDLGCNIEWPDSNSGAFQNLAPNAAASLPPMPPPYEGQGSSGNAAEHARSNSVPANILFFDPFEELTGSDDIL